jgi:hypothetical protein
MSRKSYALVSFLIIAIVLASLFFFTDAGSFLSGLMADRFQRELNENPDIIYRHYYEGLNENEKLAYINIYNKIGNFPERIEIPQLTEAELDRVFKAIIYDNPDLIYIGNTCQMLAVSGRFYFLPLYSMNRDEARQKTEQLKQKVNEIVASMPAGLDEFSKELYLHDYLVTNSVYTDKAGTDTAYSALINGEAICSGYANAMQLLLSKAGIKSTVITGIATDEMGERQSHMWNIVYIDGRPYHLDATWNDPAPDNKGAVRHLYFNVDDSTIAVSHSDFNISIPCNDIADNYHKRLGQFFDRYDDGTKARITLRLTENIKNGNSATELRFENQEAFSKAVSNLLNKGEIYDILKTVNNENGINISTSTVKYTLNERLLVIVIFTDNQTAA